MRDRDSSPETRERQPHRRAGGRSARGRDSATPRDVARQVQAPVAPPAIAAPTVADWPDLRGLGPVPREGTTAAALAAALAAAPLGVRLPHLDRADVAALFVATRRAGFGWLCLALRILLDRHDARWRDAPATRVRDLEPALDLAALVAEALDLLAARGWYSRDGGRYVPAGGPR